MGPYDSTLQMFVQTPQPIDMNVTVSGVDAVTLSGGITQQNVFGSGNHIGLQVNTSKLNTLYSLSFTQPYWTVDGVSRPSFWAASR